MKIQDKERKNPLQANLMLESQLPGMVGSTHCLGLWGPLQFKFPQDFLKNFYGHNCLPSAPFKAQSFIH